MALYAYLQQTQRLMRDTAQARVNLGDLRIYVNDARVQIALAAECLRQPATMTMVVGQQPYPFVGMALQPAPNAPVGLAGVGNVRVARLVVAGGGNRRLEMRGWEWFDTYWLSRVAPVQGPPQITSRLQPGITGTLWFAPAPDDVYPISLDTVAYPSPLVTDSDPEALPSPWTDAVPFFSAYLCCLSLRDAEGAELMWNEYQKFETRGTQLTTPTRFPRSYTGRRGAALAGARSPITGGGGQQR
jgi:hypothetical protein